MNCRARLWGLLMLTAALFALAAMPVVWASPTQQGGNWTVPTFTPTGGVPPTDTPAPPPPPSTDTPAPPPPPSTDTPAPPPPPPTSPPPTAVVASPTVAPPTTLPPTETPSPTPTALTMAEASPTPSATPPMEMTATSTATPSVKMTPLPPATMPVGIGSGPGAGDATVGDETTAPAGGAPMPAPAANGPAPSDAARTSPVLPTTPAAEPPVTDAGGEIVSTLSPPPEMTPSPKQSDVGSGPASSAPSPLLWVGGGLMLLGAVLLLVGARR